MERLQRRRAEERSELLEFQSALQVCAASQGHDQHLGRKQHIARSCRYIRCQQWLAAKPAWDKNMWLQEALAALEEAQQSAEVTAAIQSRMAEQSEVLQQLQAQLEEARQQQVRTLKLILCTVVAPWMASPVTA